VIKARLLLIEALETGGSTAPTYSRSRSQRYGRCGGLGSISSRIAVLYSIVATTTAA
jgi:hypothetical protein